MTPGNGVGLPQRLLLAWDGFWYREGSTLLMSIFRILFGMCLYREVGTSHSKNVHGIADPNYFHLPYASWIPLIPEGWYDSLHNLQVVLIVLFIAGLFYRFATTSLLLVQAWIFFSDHLNFRNHPYVFLLVLLAMVFAPAADALSVRALWRAFRDGRERILGGTAPLTFQRLIQVQICISYLYAGLHKLNPSFLGGHVLADNLPDSAPDELRDWGLLRANEMDAVEAWLSEPTNLMPFAIGSAVLELGLPILLWTRYRAWAYAAACSFHLGIGLTMNIWAFSMAMIAADLLFFDADSLRAWVARRILKSPPATAEGETAAPAGAT
jgi:hypothetical protein